MGVFRKTLPAEQRARLDAELDGLAALRATGTVRVPEKVGAGETAGQCWIELEYLELAALDRSAGAKLGFCLRERRHRHAHLASARPHCMTQSPEAF